MLQTKMTPPSMMLQPYVWAYGMTVGRITCEPLRIPLPARPKQLLTFCFGDPYRVCLPESDEVHTRSIDTLVDQPFDETG